MFQLSIWLQNSNSVSFLQPKAESANENRYEVDLSNSMHLKIFYSELSIFVGLCYLVVTFWLVCLKLKFLEHNECLFCNLISLVSSWLNKNEISFKCANIVSLFSVVTKVAEEMEMITNSEKGSYTIKYKDTLAIYHMIDIVQCCSSM